MNIWPETAVVSVQSRLGGISWLATNKRLRIGLIYMLNIQIFFLSFYFVWFPSSINCHPLNQNVSDSFRLNTVNLR